MLQEAQIGRNGAKPEASAISGRALNPEDVYFRVNGNTLGITAREFNNIHPVEFDALKVSWAEELPAVRRAEPTPLIDYDAMSYTDLKALAEERGVDIAGKRSKEALIPVLRVADVNDRLVKPAAEPDDSGADSFTKGE